MARLVAYGDSDEEVTREPAQLEIDESAKATPDVQRKAAKRRKPASSAATQKSSKSTSGPQTKQKIPASHDSTPSWKRSAHPVSISLDEKNQIQTLTMPPVPDYDLPAVKAGRPAKQAVQRVEVLLDSKKGSDKHFNVEAARSSEFHNPGHLRALEAGFEMSSGESFACTEFLSAYHSDPLPAWSSARQLNIRQAGLQSKQDTERRTNPREKIEFVEAKRGGPSEK